MGRDVCVCVSESCNCVVLHSLQKGHGNKEKATNTASMCELETWGQATEKSRCPGLGTR